MVKKYPDVEAITWSKDCPKKYKRGKPFLPNRVIRLLSLHMRRFHDWYLRVILTKLKIIMQAHFVKKMPSLKAGYVDPQPIAHLNFNYPNKWKLDSKELAVRKTVAEKEAIRNRVIKKEALKVAAYLAISFVHLQHNEVIWVPYNFMNHWIVICIDVRRSMAWVCDFADFDPVTYKDFIAILKTYTYQLM